MSLLIVAPKQNVRSKKFSGDNYVSSSWESNNQNHHNNNNQGSNYNDNQDNGGNNEFGQWNEWGQWSNCGKTCGGGWQSRKRKCNSYPGGPNCVGQGQQD